MSMENSRSSLSRSLLVVAAAALAGFAAVYVVLSLRSNGERAAGVKEVAPAPAATAPQPRKRAGLAAYSVGHMSTFVARKTPAPLPEFTFRDASGAERRLAEWKGKVVLLNLWATWCAPCRREMPDLDRLQAELGGARFEVVAISIDKGGPEKPQRFLEEVKATKLNFYHDPTGRLGTLLKAYGLPTTILVDAQGRELGRLAGPAEWGSEDAKKLIKAVLEKGSADS